MKSTIRFFPGRLRVRRVVLKCAEPGCNRRKVGWLDTSRNPGGALYNGRGERIADLREQEFACPRHGIADGSAPFLYPDPPKGVRRVD